MSTIGGLLLPQFAPFDYGRQFNQGIEGGRGILQGQTALLALEEAKRQQEAIARYEQFAREHPESILGNLQNAPGAPPGMPPAPGMTQQTFAPGMPPGAPVGVPGGQDLSRYAGVSPQGGGPMPQSIISQVMPKVTPPPQSVIGGLQGQPGGQPGGQPPSQQSQLMDLMRQDPRAAMLAQQQMQGQQDRQFKLQEQQLDWGVKVSEGVARALGGVTDQDTLEQARGWLQQISPQAAARLPQIYNKAAIENLQQQGIAVAKLAEWHKDEATAKRTELMTQRLPATMQGIRDFMTGDGGGTQAPAPTTGRPAGGPSAAPAPASPSPGKSGGAEWTFQEREDRINAEEAKYPNIPKGLSKAVAYHESRYNLNAEGDGGEAKGLFQLHAGAAKDAGIDPAQRHIPELNVQGGVKYLSQKIDQAGGDIDKALSLYNRGTLDYRGIGDPNYIQNVRQYWNKDGGAGGARTAQAPPTDPRIAGLEARIKRGKELVLEVASQPGMETQASLLNQQVNDMEKERDRIDAPRQDFLRRQAVQGQILEEKQQEGVARAQLEADTKPATNTEIDAINRGLPRDKQLSYGTTYKEIREKKLVGGQQLDPTVTKDIINTTTAIQNFEELSKAVTALPTGPLTQYVESFKERWGIDISDEKVAQRAILAGAQSQLLNARSGTAVSPSEYTRLMNELPNESNDPKVFKARLANTLRQFKNIYKTRVQVLRKLGHAIPDDLMEPLPAPEGPPAPTPTAPAPTALAPTNLDKFKQLPGVTR